MNTFHFFTRPLRFLVLLLACAVVIPASADEVSEAKKRIAARQGQVDSLKTAGLVGEANTGYLAIRGSVNGAQKSTVAAENADRKILYAAVAAKSGTAASEVGKLRAKQIRDGSASGIWVQHPDGTWKKK